MSDARTLGEYTREKFMRDHFAIEFLRVNTGPNAWLNTFAVVDSRNGNEFMVTISAEGADIEQTLGNRPLHFGGASEFDELRDLITLLHGKAAEVAK